MIYGMYPLLTGSIAQEKSLEITNNNLANINTAGFKKDYPSFQKVLSSLDETANSKYAEFATLNSIKTDFSNGVVKHTGNPLDVALSGNVFFAIQSANSTVYTRNGHFTLNANNDLVDSNGNNVLGSNGPVNIPSGDVIILSDGSITVDGDEIDKLKIVSVSNLKKMGDNLFEKSIDSIEGTLDEFSATQGALESANVNPVSELSDMIRTTRSYESFLKLINGLDDITSKGINDLGKI